MTSGLFVDIRAALNGVRYQPAGTLYTVNGTGIPDPFGPGFDSDIARGLIVVADGLWEWQPIGYPAAMFPMGPSVQVGVAEVIDQINKPWRAGRKIALSGYSQGALVTDYVWRDHILAPGGQLHNRLGDVVAIVNFGDPMRCPGVSNGNVRAGFAVPKKLDGFTTGGIAGTADLTKDQTPDFLLSCNLDGDLYGSAPVGDNPWTNIPKVGHNEQLIFDAVMQFDGHDFMAFAEELAALLLMPLSQLIPLVQAIWNGLQFAFQGPNAPHWKYGPFVPAMTDYLIEVGHAQPGVTL